MDCRDRKTKPELTVAVSLFACDHGTSGIGRYMVDMMNELLELGAQHTWHIWVAEEDVGVFPFLGPEGPENVRLHAVGDRWNKPVASLIWHASVLPGEIRKVEADVLYLPAGNRRLVPFAPIPAAAVVHDLSSFHVKGKYDPLRMLYVKRFLPWLIRRTEKVITISSSSASDITNLARYPEEKVTIIGLGYDQKVFRPHDRGLCHNTLGMRYEGFPRHYLFYISRLEHPGKNHVGLLHAYKKVLDVDPGFKPDLVFAGGRWNGAEVIDRTISDLGLGDRVHMLGFVADDDLPLLYSGADALVFPSLFEGFGLPIIEAQASGIPVAAADISSLPEVVGQAGVLFDPYDTDAIADAIRRIDADAQLRKRLVEDGFVNARRFTWHEAAEQSLEILEGCADAA